MSAVRSAADEAHREQTSERVTESHTRLARSGHVTGGRVFGYRNQDVTIGIDAHGRPLRSHVERVIEPEQAAVVRRIFEMHASGTGLKGIAKLLNSEGATAPKPFIRRDTSKVLPHSKWAPSTIRAILSRELYRGVVVWKRSRKRTDWGKVKQRPRPESEWVRAEVEGLRIISDELWNAVQSRRKQVEGQAMRFNSGRLSGRPPKHAVKNLLAGLATCALCGGGLVVETSGRSTGRVPEYVCHRRRHSGTCGNTLRVPVERLNEAVLVAVEEHALTPEAVEQVILLTERDDVRDRELLLERERADIQKRRKRVQEAIEVGGDVPSLVSRLGELDARGITIAAELAALQPIPRLDAKVIEDRLAEWRRLLRQSTTQGRAVLQRVLRGRLSSRHTPRARATTSAGRRGTTAFSAASFADRPAWVPEGKYLNFTPEDTFDGDYGRLLERAYQRVYGKGVTSPAGFEPAFWP